MRAWAWLNDFSRTFNDFGRTETHVGYGPRAYSPEPGSSRYIDFVTSEDRVIAGIVVEVLDGADEDVAAVIMYGKASLQIGKHTDINLPIWRTKRDFATPLKATAGERIVLEVFYPKRDYKRPVALGADLNMAAAYPVP